MSTDKESKKEDENKNDSSSSSSSNDHQQVYGSTPIANGEQITTMPTTVKKRPQQQQQQQQSLQGAILVASFGSFPGAGSRLGPFFCLGRLGRGTFCSIHRCIDLRYFHHNNNNNAQQQPQQRHRMVAAKVELSTFVDSGVLEGEATMLKHLHETLPPNSVPAFMGHYRADQASALVMQYLPGEDMHQLRHRQKGRRLSVPDAVYLTADVMLPLLQRMHQVGVVHRDVKPSNVVRIGTNESNKEFCMVDFGLSKSIVVPKDAPIADPEHIWTGQTWSRNGGASELEEEVGCLRKERPTAEFRGTSMYASLRIHQLKDYSRRDDMWSLLYVFCDLVSGGLPWMSHAANRDRDECQKLKERIHGNNNNKDNKDETELLLMGEEYYVSSYNRDLARKKGVDESKLPKLAEPLAMSKDAHKVQLLRTAFAHVSQLSFVEEPDYDLIRNCLNGFLDNDGNTVVKQDEKETVAPMDWNYTPHTYVSSNSKRRSLEFRQSIPTWELLDEPDPLDDDVLNEADAERKSQANVGEPSKKNLQSDEEDMARLPLALQFRVAQMEFNTKHAANVSPHVALRDWLRCILELLHGRWDSYRYEKGKHRSDTDGFRRELYLKLLEKCEMGAKAFDNFHSRACFYETPHAAAAAAAASSSSLEEPKPKRRKIAISLGGGGDSTKQASDNDDDDSFHGSLMMLSKALFGMRVCIAEERRKTFAPPPALSFGSSGGSF